MDIDIRDSELTADAFDECGPLLQLKSFAFSGESLFGCEESLVRWLAKQTILERLICSPQLSAPSLHKLAGLTKLKQTYVTLAADAPNHRFKPSSTGQLCDCWDVYPREDCPDAALDELGTFDR